MAGNDPRWTCRVRVVGAEGDPAGVGAHLRLVGEVPTAALGVSAAFDNLPSFDQASALGATHFHVAIVPRDCPPTTDRQVPWANRQEWLAHAGQVSKEREQAMTRTWAELRGGHLPSSGLTAGLGAPPCPAIRRVSQYAGRVTHSGTLGAPLGPQWRALYGLFGDER